MESLFDSRVRKEHTTYKMNDDLGIGSILKYNNQWIITENFYDALPDGCTKCAFTRICAGERPLRCYVANQEIRLIFLEI